MTTPDDLLIIRLALANRMVTQEQVDACLEDEAPSDESIGQQLVRRGFLAPEALAMLRRIQGRAPAEATAPSDGPSPSTNAPTILPPAPAPPPPRRKARDEGPTRALKAPPGKPARPARAEPSRPPTPAGSSLPGDPGDADLARVIRGLGLVPDDLLPEARGLAATLPAAGDRPRLLRACIQKAFLTPGQAEQVLEALGGREYRCEGCGAALPGPATAGVRCPDCGLALPLPGAAIDPDGPTPGTSASVGPILATIVVVCGVNRGYVYAVREGAKLTIGRRSANKLRLFDPLASREHAVVEHVGGRPRLADASSKSGLFVNGARASAHDLRGGDVFRIGHTIFEYRAELAPVRKAVAAPVPTVPEEDVDDILFGRIAVKLGLVRRRDLEVALAAQEAGESRPLGKILLEQGTLVDDGLLRVLTVQRRNLARRGHYSSQARENMLFGRMALREGFLREVQLNEAVRAQARQEETAGLHLRLGEVMVRRKSLTTAQVATILRAQGKSGGGPAIENYEIEEKLGEGGMGAVFKGRQLSLDRPVAIKILAPRLVAEPGYVDRFMREARAAGRLNHQNIVRAIDVGRVGSLYYFVMEYIPGETASERLRRTGPLPEADVRKLGLEIARALAHAAQHDLVHRDVKPDNIMLATDGTIKLLDLGLARGTGSEPGVTQSSGGEIVGTPNYVSPEQAKGLGSLDARSDLYSLGATLYHVLTNELPFKGEAAPVVVMARHITDQLDNPKDLVTCSEGIAQVIAHCLVKDRRRRYQGATELIADLEALDRGEAPPHARKSTGRSTVRRR